jgi:hypothetical protein
MAFDQVNELVHDDVVHQTDGQLERFPVEVHHAAFAA